MLPPRETPVHRVAAVDCGTNTIRLLVADLAVDGRTVDLREVHREMRVVRLGEGVDRTGRLSAAGLERTGGALQDYAETARRLGATRTRMVATSAARDAANRDELVALTEHTLGVPAEIVTGVEEAALSFAGAVRGLPTEPPLVVLDVGGGSTELVVGRTGVERSVSIDVGSVRLTERYFGEDPPIPAQVAAATSTVVELLRPARETLAIPPGARLVGVAGTVTTMVAMALALPAYDRTAIHHAVVPAAELRTVTDRLLRATRDERAAEPTMHPGRVDVIAAGAVIVRAVLDELGVDELTASETDNLDGIALTLA